MRREWTKLPCSPQIQSGRFLKRNIYVNVEEFWRGWHLSFCFLGISKVYSVHCPPRPHNNLSEGTKNWKLPPCHSIRHRHPCTWFFEERFSFAQPFPEILSFELHSSPALEMRQVLTPPRGGGSLQGRKDHVSGKGQSWKVRLSSHFKPYALWLMDWLIDRLILIQSLLLEIVIGYGSVMNKYLWLTVFSGFGLYDNAQELVIPSSVLNNIVVVPQNLMKQTKKMQSFLMKKTFCLTGHRWAIYCHERMNSFQI